MRALLAVVEAGSFSAGARRLKRAQSAVSVAMANLEAQLGVALWDRSGKVPKLTPSGRVIASSAERVLAEVDALRRLASGMVSGLEPAVSLCVDALFPVPALVDLCAAFCAAFPTVELRVDTQVLTAVHARVLSGDASLGVAIAGAAPLPRGLEQTIVSSVRLLPVASSRHPLASKRAPALSRAALDDAVQIVLSERSDAGVPDQGVVSTRTWRVGDLATKQAFIVAGLGWGNLPEHLVAEDLRAGRLVTLASPALPSAGLLVPLGAITRSDAHLGPAHRWMLAELPARAPAAEARQIHRSKR